MGASMKRTILVGIVALALAISACAESDSARSVSATDSKPESSTTTIASPPVAESGEESTTTLPSTTTTIAPTTTTSAPATTTTMTGWVADQKFEALVQSLEVGEPMVSGRMEGSMRMTGLDPQESGIAEMEILFASAFDAESGDTSFLMDTSSMAGMQALEGEQTELEEALVGKFETRQIGDRVFLNFPIFTLMLGAETEWISMPLEGSEQYTNSSEGFPSDPGEVLDSYDGADASIDKIGPEDVNGVSAIHYRITLNTAGLLDQMSPSEREAAGYSPVFAEGLIPLDLWVSDEGHLVRIVLEINADMVEMPPDEAFGLLVLEYNMFDINQPVVVSPPPASDVTAIEDLEPVFGLDLEI